MECLNCKTEIKQKPGKRAPKFCGTTCRSNFWQKAKRKERHADVSTKKPKAEPAVAKAATTPPKKTAENKLTITLQEVRDMCPPELKGVDRTIWINEKKIEYGL